MTDVMFGNAISSLSALPSSFTLSALNDGAFLLAVQSRSLPGEYHNEHVTASNFLSSIACDALQMLGLGTMASCSSQQYSPRVHNHNNLYNKLSIESNDGILSDFFVVKCLSPDADGMLSIGNFFINGLLSTLYVPLSCICNPTTIPWQIIEPQFGEVKCVAKYNKMLIEAIHVTSDSFDGWLWLDGATEYDLAAFRLSSDISSASFVSCNADNTKFRTVSLSTFVKASNLSAPFTYALSNNGYLPSHHHTISLSCKNVQVSANGVVKVTEDVPGQNPGKSIHLGSGWVENATANISNIKTYRHSGKSYTLSCTQHKTAGSGTHQWIMWQISSLYYYDEDQQQLASPIGLDIWARGGNYASFSDIKANVTCDIEFDQSVFPRRLSVLKASSSAGETYPSHNTMPMMVYVGRRKAML